MEAVNRIRYVPELNKIYKSQRREGLFSDYGQALIEKTIACCVKNVECAEGSANLCGFLADNHGLNQIFEFHPPEIVVCVYPEQGVVRYLLNEDEEFFSNVHQNPDPIVIRQIVRGIHLHPIRTDDYLWWGRRKNSIPNRVNGLILFSRGIREYDFRVD